MGTGATSVRSLSAAQRIARLEALLEQAISQTLVDVELETNLVWRPAGTGVVNENVFTTWAALLAAMQKIDGQINVTVDTSEGAAVVPAGTHSFLQPTNGVTQGNADIHWIAMTAGTAFTIADGAIFTGVARMTWNAFAVTFQGATPLFTKLGGILELGFSGSANTLNCSAGLDMAVASGGTVSVDLDSTLLVTLGGFSATGAASILAINVTNFARVGGNTIGIAAGATLAVNKWNTSATIALGQAGLAGGALTPGVDYFVRAGFSPTASSAFTDATATVAPNPANQTTPGANTDVIAAIATPSASGIYLAAIKITGTTTAADVVTCTVRTHTKAATIVVANGTATGQGCFVSTASGPITYGGGTTDATHWTEPQTADAAGKFTFSYYGIVFGTAGAGGFTVGNNTAIAGAIQNAAHDVTGLSGSISMTEMPAG